MFRHDVKSEWEYKNAGKPRIGVSPPAVYVHDVNSEREYVEEHLFYGVASL